MAVVVVNFVVVVETLEVVFVKGVAGWWKGRALKQR